MSDAAITNALVPYATTGDVGRASIAANNPAGAILCGLGDIPAQVFDKAGVTWLLAGYPVTADDVFEVNAMLAKHPWFAEALMRAATRQLGLFITESGTEIISAQQLQDRLLPYVPFASDLELDGEYLLLSLETWQRLGPLATPHNPWQPEKNDCDNFAGIQWGVLRNVTLPNVYAQTAIGFCATWQDVGGARQGHAVCLLPLAGGGVAVLENTGDVYPLAADMSYADRTQVRIIQMMI